LVVAMMLSCETGAGSIPIGDWRSSCALWWHGCFDTWRSIVSVMFGAWSTADTAEAVQRWIEPW